MPLRVAVWGAAGQVAAWLPAIVPHHSTGG